MAKQQTRVPGEALAPEEATKQAVQAAPSDLPNAIDVDPNMITGPVLTRQGWIIPAEKKKA